MECPLLVWMLSLNRDTSKDVSICPLACVVGFDEQGVYRNTMRAIIWSGNAPPIPIFHMHRQMSTLSVRASFIFRRITFSNLAAGQIITAMLPLLMMRHRRISRSKWRDCVTANGKHYIEQVRSALSFDKRVTLIVYFDFEGS